MENDPNLSGPSLKSFVRKSGEAQMCFDLGSCTNKQVSDFIFNILTDQHTHDIALELDMKNKHLADVYVSWPYGKDVFAEKVIKRIQKLSISL